MGLTEFTNVGLYFKHTIKVTPMGPTQTFKRDRRIGSFHGWAKQSSNFRFENRTSTSTSVMPVPLKTMATLRKTTPQARPAPPMSPFSGRPSLFPVFLHHLER